MKNTILSEELLDAIKKGERVNTEMIYGHISTPRTPDSVFDITYDGNGKEFKRAINTERWIEWIESVAQAGADENADIHTKPIVDSKFYSQCKLAYHSINKNRDENQNSGANWTYHGGMFPISLNGEEQIDRALTALLDVKNVSIKAKSTDLLKFGKDPKWGSESVQEQEFDHDELNTYIEFISGRC